MLKVAGKMVLSVNTTIQAEGAILNTAGEALETKINEREDLEDDVKSVVTAEHTSDDAGQAAYKHAIGVITEQMPGNVTGWQGLGVEISKDDVKASICAKPTNCHASHGDAPHSVDAICNTDKTRKYLKAQITNGLPDMPAGYIDVTVIKETGKHVVFLLPAGYIGVQLWIILTPWNTFGMGNPSDPFKCDPMS
jgi:hypothetical protein